MAHNSIEKDILQQALLNKQCFCLSWSLPYFNFQKANECSAMLFSLPEEKERKDEYLAQTCGFPHVSASFPTLCIPESVHHSHNASYTLESTPNKPLETQIEH